jgi:hypothetical protein
MEIQQIKKYWTDTEGRLYNYKLSQLNNPRLLKITIDFLIDCGLPDSCAPGLSFNDCNDDTIPTPNHVYNIDIEELTII